MQAQPILLINDHIEMLPSSTNALRTVASTTHAPALSHLIKTNKCQPKQNATDGAEMRGATTTARRMEEDDDGEVEEEEEEEEDVEGREGGGRREGRRRGAGGPCA